MARKPREMRSGRRSTFPAAEHVHEGILGRLQRLRRVSGQTLDRIPISCRIWESFLSCILVFSLALLAAVALSPTAHAQGAPDTKWPDTFILVHGYAASQKAKAAAKKGEKNPKISGTGKASTRTTSKASTFRARWRRRPTRMESR
jgi:hypothetical protein